MDHAFRFTEMEDLRALFLFVLQDDSKNKFMANIDVHDGRILARIVNPDTREVTKVRDGQWVVRSGQDLTVMDDDKFNAEYQHILA
jgi:hypothetical protein